MSFVLVPLTVMTESSWSSILAKWHDSVNTGVCFLSQSCLQIMYFEVTHTYVFTCFLESTSASVTHPANEECGEELVIRACCGTAWPSEYWPELGQRWTSRRLLPARRCPAERCESHWQWWHEYDVTWAFKWVRSTWSWNKLILNGDRVHVVLSVNAYIRDV